MNEVAFRDDDGITKKIKQEIEKATKENAVSNVKADIAKLKDAAPVGSELSPEEKAVLRRVEEELEEAESETNREITLTEEEQKMLDSLRDRYVWSDVYASSTAALKDVFRALRDHAKNLDDHSAALREIAEAGDKYTAEYLQKKQNQERETFTNKAEALYDRVSSALKQIKVNLVADAEVLRLDDSKFTTAITLINTAGGNCGSETLGQIAEQFKGDISSLRALKAAAENVGASGKAFESLLFEPISAVGALQVAARDVFGCSPAMPGMTVSAVFHDVGQLKFKTIRMGKELERIANLANIPLTAWDTGITEDDDAAAFLAGFTQ